MIYKNRYIIFLILLLGLGMLSNATPAETVSKNQSLSPAPTAQAFLDKYTQALDSTENFIDTFEETERADFRLPVPGSPRISGTSYKYGENRSDGHRSYQRVYTWGDVSARDRNVPKDKPKYNLWLVDQTFSYVHGRFVNDSRSTGQVCRLPQEPGTTPKVLSRCGTSSYLLGFIGADQRLDTVLRHADALSVRPKTESVNGSDCWVLDAHTKYGHYSVWLDPKHGYHPARIRRQAGEGEWQTDDLLLGRGYRMTDDLENVRFERIGDTWVPMEADGRSHSVYGNSGIFNKDETHFKRTSILLNPDHDQLGSFDDPLEHPENDPELVDGTRVYLDMTGTSYIWQDGQVVLDEERNTK